MIVGYVSYDLHRRRARPMVSQRTKTAQADREDRLGGGTKLWAQTANPSRHATLPARRSYLTRLCSLNPNKGWMYVPRCRNASAAENTAKRRRG